ncbi:MAG: mechanosensitive ion channel family protein [Tannerella sp.]|jgi:MscS family membrane protein|nr:mechanosensitive ion channel family protein [Tannerella sp.]
MLEKVYYGNSLEDWGISLLIIVGGLVLNQLILLVNRMVIQRITKKSKTRYDTIFFDALKKPLLCGVMLAAIRVACERLNLGEQAQDFMTRSCQILLTLNVTWFIARIVVALVEESFFREGGGPRKKDTRLNRHLFPVVKRSLLVLIWLIGVVTALGEAGVEVRSLWGTLGIGGLAFALASQDTVKNMLGGITIFLDRPFRPGDVIRFDATEGTVEDIGLRSTRIRTYDRQLVVIPNSKLMDVSVVNITLEPARRVVLTLGLTYDTRCEQMEHALTLLKRIPRAVPEVSDRELAATFSDYGDSALLITFIYFIRKPADIRETVSRVNFEILRTFNEAGLNFAFPTQTVYLEGNKA